MEFKLEKIRTYPIVAKGSLQIVYKKGRFVYKELNTAQYSVSPKTVIKDIQNFYRRCLLVGISVPKIAKIPYLVDGCIIVNKYSYEGKPFRDYLNLKKFALLYPQLLRTIDKGLSSNLGISSFHEQFVINGRRLVFIDFFIPATIAAFRHYKKEEEAKNYFLVQFSKNSVILSTYSHYWEVARQNRPIIEAVFNRFCERKLADYSLARKTKETRSFKWYLENHKKLETFKSKWLLVRGDRVIQQAEVIDSLIGRAVNDDLFIYQPRKRILTKEEIINNLTIYLKLTK